MFPAQINLCVRTLLFVITFSVVNGQERKILAKLNPGCSECTTNNTLVYIRADGPKDTIHQVWDFTRGTPTVIYTIASPNSTFNVNWEYMLPVNFTMSEKPVYSFAAAINELYEYDDIHDNGHIDEKCPKRVYPLWHLSWRLNDSILTDKEAMVRMHGHYRDQGKSGIIDVKLDLLPYKDYAAELPHLIHSANSTLVDVRMVNLTTSRDFKSSRFALRFVLVSTDSTVDSMRYTVRKSLDDEHTPGVFEIIEVKTPATYRSADGGFMQFRPVAYTEPERGVSSSTNAHISNIGRASLPHKSPLMVFYSGFNESILLVEDMFISFGMPGDGFYIQHNFTAWSFTIGYGAPPLESFSLFVVIIICIGLGVPILLALSGIGYVLVQRLRTSRNPPTRLYDEH